MILLSDLKNQTHIFLQEHHYNTGVFNSKLNPFISAKIIPEGENQTHIGATLGFGDIIEIGSGYKSTGYTNAFLIIKTKFGIIVAFAYDYGIPSGSFAVTKSGSEFFLKYKF